MEFSAKIVGLEDAMKAMQAAFPKNQEQQRRLLNATMRRSATPTLLADAKTRAASLGGSGALADSLGIRTSGKGIMRSGNKVAGVYITPLRYKPSALFKYLSHYYPGSKSDSVIVDGIRHGHLIEFGHATKGGGHVAARPFLGPAIDSQFSPYISRFAMDLGKKVEAAVKRRARKAKK